MHLVWKDAKGEGEAEVKPVTLVVAVLPSLIVETYPYLCGDNKSAPLHSHCLISSQQ